MPTNQACPLHLTVPGNRTTRAEPEVRVTGAIDGVEWAVSAEPVPFTAAMLEMERLVAAVVAGSSPERIWLLEHPEVYTAGTSAQPDEVLDTGAIPIVRTGRGGRHTYHGPGQRVIYPVIDLRRRRQDVRLFVHSLQAWAIAALALLRVNAATRPDRVGLWVPLAAGEEGKIAAVGVRIRRWVTCHGLAINVDPDLRRFSGIIPCGLRDHPVVSLRSLGRNGSMGELDEALRRTCREYFLAPLSRL